MDRIVDITTDGRHLSVTRGFMVVSNNGDEVGRIALDEIAALIVHAHGVTYSNNLFVKLAAQGTFVVLCGPNHSPVSCVWPLSGHHAQGARMRAQWNATKPLQKRIWQLIVQNKIRMQGAVISSNAADPGAFEMLARKVRSGDPENVEAQAARRYWPLLLGDEFRRDQSAGGANALLNYGYAVLRAIISRAIVASGLHPTIGIFHHNRQNAFALADDLMEPFRPLVDQSVKRLFTAGVNDVDAEAKAALTRITAFDLVIDGQTSPLNVAANRLAHSLAASFESGKVSLALPEPLSPLELTEIGAPG
jgi:CRISPR-associated protein Cas1